MADFTKWRGSPRHPTRASALFLAACAAAFVFAPSIGRAAEPPAGVLVRSTASGVADANFAEVCAFYGLDIDDITVSDAAELAWAVDGGVRRGARFIAVNARTLASLADSSAVRAFRAAAGSGHEVVIYDVGAVGDTSSLSRLGAPVSLVRLPGPVARVAVTSSAPEITRELSGVVASTTSISATGLATLPSDATVLARVVDAGDHALPIVSESRLGEGNVILLSSGSEVSLSGGALPRYYTPEHLGDVAMLMAVVRHAAGDLAWHRDTDFANLTIDDPMLVERYGSLDYRSLLSHAESAGFHATVAFIPYNVSRCDPRVAALIRDNTRFLSLAVHGDNHDIGEFDPPESRERVAADLSQAIKRMDAFSAETSVPYSRVEVFPRHLGSLFSVSSLGRLPYLATVNATQIPPDAKSALSRFFGMSPAETQFGGFPLIGRRYVPVGRPPVAAALDLFIGRPAMIYAHEDYFSSGPGAFDSAATWLNSRGRVKWTNLDEIARNLYLEKSRQDGSVDVAWFGQVLSLRNGSRSPKVYHVRRANIDPDAFFTVTADGVPIDHALNAGTLSLDPIIPAGQTMVIRILPPTLASDERLGLLASLREAIEVPVVRRLSEFRDRWLAQTPSGRALLQTGRRAILVRGLALGLVTLGVVGTLYKVRRRRSGHVSLR